MNFGMFTDFHVRGGNTQAESFDESFDQVMAAERLGFDTVWLAEHHFSPERAVLASPMIVASAICAKTERIRIGLAVQVLPLTNPLRVAEEAATVDHISKGRFEFGIGRSGLTRYYQGYNVQYEESRPRFLEALAIITKAWNQEQFSYAGQFNSYENVTVVPKPLQQPHPPITVAVAGEDTFPLIGSMGHSIFVSMNTPKEQLINRLAAYTKSRKEAGIEDPGGISIRVPVYVAETRDKAHSEPEESARHALAYAAQELSQTAASPEAATRMHRMANTPYSEILANRVLFGTPDELVERLNILQEELGINGIVMECNYGGRIPYTQVINSLRLLSEKVMPHFK
jgi:alkanesulfonate monooxygenase SsuD/methylene tetrahydromethanopterin reductase-like flavin-dependent oxidoreductase (luciferase family)